MFPTSSPENIQRDFSLFHEAFKHIHSYFRMRDDKMEEEFLKFNKHQKSITIILSTAVLFTCIFLPADFLNFVYASTNTQKLYSILHGLFSLSVSASLWVMLFAQISSSNYFNSLEIFERGLLLSSFLKITLFSLRNMLVSNYSTFKDLLFGLQCSSGSNFLLPIEILAFTVLPPIIFTITLHKTRIEYIVLWIIITNISVLFTTILIPGNWIYILPFLMWTAISFFIVIDIFSQKIDAFLIHRKYKQMLYEREANADIYHANELRHMIGNVAHDLKTPLASFTAGLIAITDIVEDVEQTILSNQVVDVNYRLRAVRTIRSCVKSIQNANSFMLMTINRCLDYTKINKGFVLVPRYETVNFSECVCIPIQCMKDMQDRISISLHSIPQEVCSHIVTDKQWLQENILCLLSNAVKYSSQGNVDVTITLEKNPQAQQRIDLLTRSSSEVGLCSINSDDDDDEPMIDTDEFLFKSRSVDATMEAKSDSGDKGDMFLKVQVEDHGIGLSDEAMKTLFSAAKQAQRLAGGTGLGLYSLAKRLEALNGLYGVKARSDKQHGSTFWFMIPYQPDMDAADLYKDDHTETSQGYSGSEQNGEITDSPCRTRNKHSQLDTFISHFLRGKLSQLSIANMAELAESSISMVESMDIPSSLPAHAIHQSDDISVLSTVSSDAKPFASESVLPSHVLLSPASMTNQQILSPPDVPLLPLPPPIIGSPSISQSPNAEYIAKTISARGQSDKQTIEKPHSDRKKEAYSTLIVDDAPTIIKLTTMLLTRHGHDVSVAENGEVAVMKLKEKWIESHGTKGYDFILMDLQMPVMDGLQATATIRALEVANKAKVNTNPPNDPALPGGMSLPTASSLPPHQLIIGMSANSDYDTMQAAFHAGIDDFMGKPFDLSLFNSITRKLKASPSSIPTIQQ